MKLIALKTGDFSLHPAWGPVVSLVKDAEIDADIDEVSAKRLIKKGLARVAISDDFEDIESGETGDGENGEEGETGENPKEGENSGEGEGDEGSGEGSQPTPEGGEENADSVGEGETVPEESEVVLTTEEKILDMIKDVEDLAEKRSLIQEWGVVNAGLKVSKSKSVDNMIIDIIAAVDAKEETE